MCQFYKICEIYIHRDNFQTERIQGFFIRKSGLEKII